MNDGCRKVAWGVGGGLVLLMGMYLVAMKIQDRLVNDSSKTIAELKRVLTIDPVVMVGSRVMSESPNSKSELVVASQRLMQDLKYEVSWMGSKKELSVMGEFVAKSGYRGKDGIWIRLGESTNQLVVEYGAPELLSCELIKIQTVEENDGLWNRLSAEDRDAVHNELLRRAKESAKQRDLLPAAEQKLHELIAPLQGGKEIEIVLRRKK